MELAAPLAQSTSTRSLPKSVAETKPANHSAYCSRSFLFARQHVASGSRRFRGSLRQLFQVREDVGFDLVFQLVGQLVAIGAKDLDAIVLPGIMRSGDDDARAENDSRA